MHNSAIPSPIHPILRDCAQEPLARCATDLARRGTCLVLVERSIPRDGLPLPLPQEREEAARFPDPLRADGYVLRRQIARAIIAEAIGIEAGRLRLQANAAGAVQIEGVSAPLHLSFSARGAFGLIGIAHQPLGVDLELPIAPDAIPFNLLRPDERESIMAQPLKERSASFLHLWTLKEAIAKALGRGFAIAPEEIRLPSSPVPPQAGFEWRARNNHWMPHAACLLTWQINRALCLSRSNNQNGMKERLFLATALLPA